MDIGVVGLGLIGGSMAKTIRRNTPHTVLGTDTNPQVMYKARLLEAIDGDLTDERLAICDIVFIATWPRAAVTYVQEHAAAFKKGAWVIDLCGVKRAVCGPLFETAREPSSAGTRWRASSTGDSTMRRQRCLTTPP